MISTRVASGTIQIGRSTTFTFRIQPTLAANEFISSLVLLPLHIYDNDPHPEPWDSLSVDFASTGQSFVVYNTGAPARDSIDMITWYAYIAQVS